VDGERQLRYTEWGRSGVAYKAYEGPEAVVVVVVIVVVMEEVVVVVF
jgi:hypothetical protein